MLSARETRAPIACTYPPLTPSCRPQEFVYGAAAGHAALGGLCLWRGFDEEEKWESKEFFKKKEDEDK